MQAAATAARAAASSGTGAAAAAASSVRAAAAPNNEWLRLGAKLGYRIDGRGEFKDDFLVSGLVQLGELEFANQSDHFHLPFIGNFSNLSSELTDEEFGQRIRKLIADPGLSFGISPYFVSGMRPARLTTYGYAGWKVNSGRDFVDTSKTRYLHQGRFSGGMALDAFVVKGIDNPLLLSAEVGYIVPTRKVYQQIFGTPLESNILNLELTAIIPVQGMGLMAQTIVAEHAGPTWRVGFLYIKNAHESGGGG
ncbi:MAG TPA: hypothetical protein VKA84_01675, partial [Gemmatimonadaceae bacterium]|nr:hypothetical protein [Gemmatimonadaceae bacterium]